MRSRTILTLGILALASPALARPDPAPVKVVRPTLQVRLAPLDDLIGDLRYAVKKLGREEEAKQIEQMLKDRTGPKGLEGVDTKKPIALIGTIAKKLDESELLLLLPISDEKTFLSFLDAAGLKPTKEKDGSYTMSVENVPFPILFRFANGHLYGTLKFTNATVLAAADKLPKPAVAMAGNTGMVSLALNLDAVPPSVRKAVVPAAALQLGNLKDREMPGATEKQKELRDAVIDEAMRLGKQAIEDGATLRLSLALDRKADALNLSAQVEGPKGSSLAQDIASLSKRISLGPAVLSKEAVLAGYVNLPIPASVRKLIGPVVDEAFDAKLKEADKGGRELLQPVAEALKPTLKADSLTLAADLRGPGKGGKFGFLTYLRLEKGEALEKAVKELLAKLPAEARGPIKTDVDKAEGVAVHRIEPQNLTERAEALLGKGAIYAAARQDALLVTGGEGGLAAVKAALAVKPEAGRLLHFQMAASKLQYLVEKNAKETKEASNKAFGAKEGDKVALSLSGGERLDLHLRVDLAVVKFAVLLGGVNQEKADR